MMIKSFSSVHVLSDSKYRCCLLNVFITVSLFGGVYFIGNAFLTNEFTTVQTSKRGISGAKLDEQSDKCKNRCRPLGSEALPEGIVAKTYNLEMRPLWGDVIRKSKRSVSLLAMAVGVKQKEVVTRIIKKFMGNGFDVMLFHYDGLVNEWNDLGWSFPVIHVSAMNQTKWWFAKRFLHPDIVAEYEYIFLWDEDLGVENFRPERYLAIVRSEGLELSQPALDPTKAEVHYLITMHRRGSKVHRRYYKSRGGGRCYGNSTDPPCNDLIHAWGLDMKLGYCVQGDRAMNVGVVDSEYIVHMGLSTLGGVDGMKLNGTVTSANSQASHQSDSEPLGNSLAHKLDSRSSVRMQSYKEMMIFKKRWDNAVKEDQCLVDPYQQPSKSKVARR